MGAMRALRKWVCAALLALSPLLLATALPAQDAAWLAAPGSPDFNTGANWSTGTVPTGTAIFGSSAEVNLSTSVNTGLGGFTFNVGASDYTLINNNTLQFTGAGIVINGGSLALTNDNTLLFSGGSSAGAATITNNALLQFEGTSTAGNANITNNCCLFFTNASSAGSATITNNGNMEFQDTSTAGNATILNNFLLTFMGSSTAGNANIVNDGGLAFIGTSTAGNATITNNATLVFAETSTAGSATILNNCCLMFTDASSAGSATIVNNGNMEFLDTSTAGSAVITNNASLNFLGSSTAGNATIFNNCCLVFGDSSTAGNATIDTQNGGHTFFIDNASGGIARFVVNTGGQLDISGLATTGTTAGSIEGAGSIVLGDKQLTVGALNSNTLFSGVIEGLGGSLVKEGSGALTLSGANTYTGPTTVAAGTLVVNGSLVSGVFVNAGGMLGGTGRVGALAILAGGVHSPGNSIGTQTINGNYVNAGTLLIEANAAGQADKVIVNGGVDITGATLRIMEAAGAYGPAQQYLIVENNGGGAVVGNFALVTNNFAFLIPTVTTTGGDGNDVVLTLTRNDVALSDVALTPNQRAVAGALQNGFRSEAGSEGAIVINSLLMLSAEGARAAFDLMSGEIHASIAHIFVSQSRQLTNLAAERLWDVAAGGGGPSAGLQGSQMMGLGLAPGQVHERMGLGVAEAEEERPRPSRIGTWVRGYGDIGRINGDGNAERLQSRGGGIVVGGDAPLAPGIVAGVMGGWGTSAADVERRRSSAEIESGHVAAYARAVMGDVLLKGVASYSHHAIDVSRGIAFAGLAQTARSSYGADQATLYGEVGWRWRLGSLGVMPLAALRWSHASVNGFVEEGAGVLNLASDGTAFGMLDAIAGIRIGTTFSAHGLTWVPQARVAWTHSFGDVDPQVGLSFLGGGSFVVSGVVRDPDSLTLGAGLNVLRGETVSGFVDYGANFFGGGHEHAVSAGLRVRF